MDAPHTDDSALAGRSDILAVCRVRFSDGKTEVSGTLTPDRRFPIGSVSKTLTALLAARLYVEGIVEWDVPVLDSESRWPSLTLAALLRHTSGVPFELSPHHWFGNPLSDAELTASEADLAALSLPPGTWHYSNYGYALAARILERATGESYVELLHRLVLDPLGLRSTGFPDPATEGRPKLGAAAPAGDVWSTLSDLVILADALAGRRPEVVSWPMLALLFQGATPGPDGTLNGAGLMTVPDGPHRLIVAAGTIANHTTAVIVWPGRGASIQVGRASVSRARLLEEAARHWRRSENPSRRLWWDGQQVDLVRHDDTIELVVRETTWPYPLFIGRVADARISGTNWLGEPVELVDHGDCVSGPSLRLTADVGRSAHHHDGAV